MMAWDERTESLLDLWDDPGVAKDDPRFWQSLLDVIPGATSRRSRPGSLPEVTRTAIVAASTRLLRRACRGCG